LVLAVFLSIGPASAYVAPREGADQQRPVYTALRSKIKQVKQNRQRIQELNAVTIQKIAVLKQAVAEMRHSPERVTPAQVSALKKAVTCLACQRKIMAATRGLIRRNSIALRAHLRSRDYRVSLRDLDRIIAVQRIRIKSLEAVSSMLDEVIAVVK